MKRFHVSVSVADLGKSIDFYSTLFGVDPVLVKDDYAKWMLDDPRINFAITRSKLTRGVNHVGLQADTAKELGEIRSRLQDAHEQTFDQENAKCCYARSTKTWVRDPDNVAWETFVTHGQTSEYGDDIVTDQQQAVSNETAGCC